MNTLIVLVILVGAILLQIYLSKSENKWLGLILPLITLGYSILAVLNIIAFTSVTSTVFTAIYVFAIFNISTVILLAIYAGCREKRKKTKK